MSIVAKHSLVMTTPDNPLYENNSSNWNADHAISGATANQIVFGSGGGLGQSSQLSWDESTSNFTVGIANIFSYTSGDFIIQQVDGGFTTTFNLTSAGFAPISLTGVGGIALNTGTQGGVGQSVIAVCASGSGANSNGGDFSILLGAKTGSGTRGYLSLRDTNFGSYGVATGAGAVTRGNVGPSALTLSIWIPILIDGTLTYIEGYR
jgi:hypothetical protein